MANGSDITKSSLPVTLAVSLLVSAITGTMAAVTSAYGMRDAILVRVATDIDRATAAIRQERTDQLRYYVSKESFAEWRQQERIRQDQQYFNLLNAIERLGGKLIR